MPPQARVTGPGREDGGAWLAGSSPAMTMEGRGPENVAGTYRAVFAARNLASFAGKGRG
jgi:hypothetical protein